MGQLLSITPDSLNNDDEYIQKIFGDFKKAMMLLSRLAKILEDIIYENEVKNQKLIFREFSRTSLYQVFGQGAKIMQDLYEINSPHYNLLNLIGRIEKLIGQSENEFLKSINFYLLEPIQKFRLLYLDKLVNIKSDWNQQNEALNKLPNTNKRDQEKSIIIQRKYNILHQQLIPTVHETQQLLLKLQNNIQSIIMSHIICAKKMSSNLSHLYKLIEKQNHGSSTSDIMPLIPPISIKDYRKDIYRNKDITVITNAQTDYTNNTQSLMSQEMPHKLCDNLYLSGDKC